ncbi:hypothetical protein DPEC_G00024380 [Dallia pectoralis]|uniref:Uncharacterized protein n=1 Tax=Dallia pectoralis TaxID=75939 RepID=A0ACC2HHP6_DALPE|nr:hypothetical protein DPEC_G00024380 [Dallia pectoralis]
MTLTRCVLSTVMEQLQNGFHLDEEKKKWTDKKKKTDNKFTLDSSQDVRSCSLRETRSISFLHILVLGRT